MKKSYLSLLTVAIVVSSIIIAGCTTSNQVNPGSSSETSTNASTSLTTTAATSRTATTTSKVTPSPSASPTAASPTPPASGNIATSISFGSDPGNVKRGQTVNLNLEVIAPEQPKPMVCGNHGTVTVKQADGTALGTVTPNMPDSSGDCITTAFFKLDTSNLSPGTYKLALAYSGDSTYKGSQSQSQITITA